MLYELKTYTAHPQKRNALLQRFKAHTLPLFDKHGIEVIECWVTLDRDDQFIYMTRFADKDSRDRAWNSFADDEEWKRVKLETEANGPLLQGQSSVDLEAVLEDRGSGD